MYVCAVTKGIHHVTGNMVIGGERDTGNMIEREKTGIVTGGAETVLSGTNPHAGSARTFLTCVLFV